MARVSPEQTPLTNQFQKRPLQQQESESHYKPVVEGLVVISVVHNIFCTVLSLLIAFFFLLSILLANDPHWFSIFIFNTSLIKGGMAVYALITVNGLWAAAAPDPMISVKWKLKDVKGWLVITVSLITVETIEIVVTFAALYSVDVWQEARVFRHYCTTYAGRLTFLKIIMALFFSISCRIVSVLFVKGFYTSELKMAAVPSVIVNSESEAVVAVDEPQQQIEADYPTPPPDRGPELPEESNTV